MNGHDGIGIALAWPQTWCKQAGGWYDGVMRAVGFNRNGGYVVGHAAVLLLQRNAEQVHYFDCGRYHAPAGMCRVRNAHTDHELRVRTSAHWHSAGALPTNIDSILQEIAGNPACHGSGVLHWGAFPIHVAPALRKAMAMQERPFHAYGPFTPGGTNCSRFVHSVLLAGRPALLPRLLLAFPASVSPSPSSNVRAARSLRLYGQVVPAAAHDHQLCL